MKLSEAIRLGAMESPQAFGDMTSQVVLATRQTQFFGEIQVTREARCALGAAFHAAGCRPFDVIAEADDNESVSFRGRAGVTKGQAVRRIAMPPEWPMYITVACPSSECLQQIAPCLAYRDILLRMIPHLNDRHQWTREQIAEWVESIEGRVIAVGAFAAATEE